MARNARENALPPAGIPGKEVWLDETGAQTEISFYHSPVDVDRNTPCSKADIYSILGIVVDHVVSGHDSMAQFFYQLIIVQWGM
jgi:hypothetical protein